MAVYLGKVPKNIYIGREKKDLPTYLSIHLFLIYDEQECNVNMKI